MSPLPRHDLEEAIYKGKPSPVRWFTMTGAIFGGTMGFSLASITHLNLAHDHSSWKAIGFDSCVYRYHI